MNSNSFEKIIIKIQTITGLNNSEIAEKLGVSSTYLSKLKSGAKDVSSKILRNINYSFKSDLEKAKVWLVENEDKTFDVIGLGDDPDYEKRIYDFNKRANEVKELTQPFNLKYPDVTSWDQFYKLFQKMSHVEKLAILDRVGIGLGELFTKQDSKDLLPSSVADALRKIKINEDIGRDLTYVNGTMYERLPNGSYLATVDFVPFEAYARYLSDDTEDHREWGKISFVVDRIGRGRYLGFRVKNDSMFNHDNPSFYDTPDGAELFCRELQRHHWMDGFNIKNAPYGWVIVTNKNIVFKDIIDFDRINGDITCHSRNQSPEYSDFKLNLDEVNQIFKVIKRTT